MSEQEARQAVQDRFDVSRETMAALDRYVALVERWTQSINLVSKGDRERLWSRHVADSAGLLDVMPSSGIWLDLGSGGGLPAIPLSLLCRDQGRGIELCMVESDARKAAFLGTAVRELGIDARIAVQRIEALEDYRRCARFVTARALASVDKLLEYVEPLVGNEAEIALLKGRTLDSELTNARKRWHMSSQVIKHPLSIEGSILLIQGFERAHSS